MFVTLYKIGEVHCRLVGTDGFHAKAKNERFTAAGSRCRLNLKYENFTASFSRLRQKIAPKSLPHVTIIFRLQPIKSLICGVVVVVAAVVVDLQRIARNSFKMHAARAARFFCLT